jgi:soluble lytic murein transglycosylase
MAVRVGQYAPQIGVPNTRLSQPGRLQPTDNPLPEAMGQAAQQIGASVERSQLRQDEMDLLDYESKLSQLDLQSTIGDDENPGALRRLGVDAENITSTTLKAWESQTESLRPELRTPAARLQAQKMLATRREDLEQRLTKHEFDQGRVADNQRTEAALTQYGNEALQNADDPMMVKASLARANGVIQANGRRMGEAPEATAQKQVIFTSATLKDVIQSQITRDPVKALDTYKESSDLLVGSDRLQVESAIQPYITDVQSRSLGDSIWNGDDSMVATGSAAVYDAIALTESGGRQFDDAGNVIRGPAVQGSGARAVGKYQIMPATGPEAAKLAGLKWDPVAFEKDEDYNARLGRAYLDAQIKRFGGDMTLVSAAYNMGPEAAAKWATGEAYQTQSGKQWTPKGPRDPSAMPTETRNYIAKVAGRMGGQPTAMAAPTTTEAVNMREVESIRRADQIADPKLRDAAINRIQFQASNARKLIQEQERATSARKAEFTDRYNNTVAKLAAGVDVPYTERPTEEQLTAVYGDYEGPIKYKEMQTYARMAPDIATLATATTTDAAKVISKYLPDPKSPNYAFDTKVYEGMQSSWKNIQEQRNSDPASFLLKNSAVVGGRYADLMSAREQVLAAQDPATQRVAMQAMQEKGQAFSDFMIQEQARMGVPPSKRALLPAAFVTQVNEEFTAKMSEGDVTGAVNTLRSTVQAFGDGAARAIPQLGKDAGPVARMVLEGLDTRTVESYVAAAAQGDEVLKKSLGNEAWNELQDTVRQQLGPLDATGTTEWPAYFDITMKVAAHKAKLGMDPKQAATQAAAETINSRYLFAGNNGETNYRVPLHDVQGQPLDAQGVVRSAARTLNTLRPDDISTGEPIPPGVSADEYKSYRIRRIQQTARWLTAGDESGLELSFVDDAGRLVPVRDISGKPYRKTWGQLLEKAPADTVGPEFSATRSVLRGPG